MPATIPLSAHSSYYPDSCTILSDPASVDFRTFYPYTPNEVKHRKRTSRAQLKVLEDHFRRDTKPNASLRKILADQLHMSIRGVQVWFQNRRAKEKALATKARVAAAAAATTTAVSRNATPLNQQHHQQPQKPINRVDLPAVPPESNPGTPSPPPPTTNQSNSPSSSIHSDSASLTTATTASSQSSPVSTTPPQLALNHPHPIIWRTCPPTDSAADDIAYPGDLELFHSHLLNLRRGSLPTYTASSSSHLTLGPPLTDDFDPFGRRRSVDTSLLRLATHPFAHLARAKNGALFGGGRFTAPPLPHNSNSAFPPPPHQTDRVQLSSSYTTQPPLPLISNTPTPPPIDAPQRPSSSSTFESQVFDFTNTGACVPPPSSLTPLHAIRATLPGHHHVIMSSRSVASPLPGPLPSPNFSFGAPAVPACSTPPAIPSPVECDAPDLFTELHSFAFPPRGPEDNDAEDDATSAASYDAFSRFGSMASLAGSESSNTSAYYSDVGSCDLGFQPDVRRGSCGGFLNMMSNLEVSPQSGLGDARSSATAYPQPPPPENNLFSSMTTTTATTTTATTTTTTPLPADGNEQATHPYSSSPSSGQATHAYPSPSSTVVSSRGSPQDPNALPISRSSELAFALQNKQEQQQQQQQVLETVVVSENNNSNKGSVVPFYYVSDVVVENHHHPGSGGIYTPAESTATSDETATPSLGIPLLDFSSTDNAAGTTGSYHHHHHHHHHPTTTGTPATTTASSYGSFMTTTTTTTAGKNHLHYHHQDPLRGLEFPPAVTASDIYSSSSSATATTVDPSALDHHNNTYK